MMIMFICFLGFIQGSTTLTAELQQDGDAVLGSNAVKLSCYVTVEHGETVERIYIQSSLAGSVFKNVIRFNTLYNNNSFIVNGDGDYLKGRVTLKNLFSAENRTLVEYNKITCEDNVVYQCIPELDDSTTATSLNHSMEVKDSPNKPDGIPIRTPDFNMCQGMRVNFTCSGYIGTPSGYFRWTKLSNGYLTTYNDSINIDIEMKETCLFNRTSTLSIKAQKEDNNAIFKCEVIHELATTDMFQETIPEIFVYDHPYEYTVITKEPDMDYYDLTTPFIDLTCVAQGCHLPNYTWYKDTDLNTTIGNNSLYRISNVTIENRGNYICIVETIINGTEEKYNQTVTIVIQHQDHPEQLPMDGGGFADTVAGLATIAVVSVGGLVLTSIVLFKIIQKVKHLQMLNKIGVKDVETENNAEPDNEATQGIDDEGFVSEVSQQWQNNAPIQSTM